jgi:hypothetical protein
MDYIIVQHQFRNSVKDLQTITQADIDVDHDLLIADICNGLKKITRCRKGKPRWYLEKSLYSCRQEVKDALE